MRGALLHARWCGAVLVAMAACADPVASTQAERATILAIMAPTPLVVGSRITVDVAGGPLLGADVVLKVTSPAGTTLLTRAVGGDGASYVFDATDELVDQIGSGPQVLDVALVGRAGASTAFAVTWSASRALPVRLDTVQQGDVHHGELVLLDGDGFLDTTEGGMEAVLDGAFAVSGAGTTTIRVSLVATPIEAPRRTRAAFSLSSALGGVDTGTFDGTVRVVVTPRSGEPRESGPVAVSWRVLGPELFATRPESAPLSAYVFVDGAGFVTDATASSLTTLLVQGRFSADGGTSRDIDAEIVPEVVDGAHARFELEVTAETDGLVSRLFGARRGTFEGDLRARVTVGERSVTTEPLPLRLTLRGTRQLVFLRFSRDFYEALPLFGLGAASAPLRERIRARVASLYADVAVDVVLDEPSDAPPSGYSIVDIGGEDPNGIGLFGYDSSPGKDVYNLRLFDVVGGASAGRQADGSPGYGGVFVASLIYFSRHPGDGVRPAGAPMPDSLFDEIFDPVRRRPATLAESRGEGDAARVLVVGRAIDALAAVIGETIAHEVGHSLGLAQPFGPRTVFHDTEDGPGCIMDTFANRPFGERAAQPGFTPSHFCGDAPEYLHTILPP